MGERDEARLGVEMDFLIKQEGKRILRDIMRTLGFYVSSACDIELQSSEVRMHIRVLLFDQVLYDGAADSLDAWDLQERYEEIMEDRK